MTSASSVRQSRNVPASGRPRSDAIWSMIPVGAPTASFSAHRPTFASVTRLWSSPQTSFSATAVAPSIAADDDSPAPTGTSERKTRLTPGTDSGSVLVA